MNENGQQQVHPAAVAQEFMKRADMKGGEVEAYTQTFNWLAQILEGAIVVLPQDAHQLMVDERASMRADIDAYAKLHGPLPKAEAEEDIPVLEPEAEAGEPELEALES